MLMSRYRMLKRFVHDPFGIRKSGFNALETEQSEVKQMTCMNLNTAELTGLSQKSGYDDMAVAACETDNNFRLSEQPYLHPALIRTDYGDVCILTTYRQSLYSAYMML